MSSVPAGRAVVAAVFVGVEVPVGWLFATSCFFWADASAEGAESGVELETGGISTLDNCAMKWTLAAAGS